MASPLEWKGLLKWSLQHHDGTSPSEATAMSEENKKWLEEVMASLVLDESKRILEIVNSLVELADAFEIDASKRDDEHAEELFDELEDIACQIDYANFLVKLKGLEALVRLGQSPWDILRERSLSLIGTVTQNNPEAQEAAVALPALLDAAADSAQRDSEPRVRAAAISALSAISTQFSPGEERFFAMGGPQILNSVLEDEVSDPAFVVRRKAAFAVKKLFTLDEITEERRLALIPCVARLIHCLQSPDADLREKSLDALVAYGRMDRFRHVPALREEQDLLKAVQRVRLAQMDADEEGDAFHDHERSSWQELVQLLDADVRSSPDVSMAEDPDGRHNDAHDEVLMLGPSTPENVPQ